jgi:mRNA interferase MazF
VIQRGSIHWPTSAHHTGADRASAAPWSFSKPTGPPAAAWPLSSPPYSRRTRGWPRCPATCSYRRPSADSLRDSVVDVTAVITIDRVYLEPPIGLLPLDLMRQVDQGLRLVLGL